MNTLTITLNDAEYALLAAQNRYDNYCQEQMKSNLTVTVPIEITAAVCLMDWLQVNRERKLARLQSELTKLDEERKTLSSCLTFLAHEERSDFQRDMEQIEASMDEVQAELATLAI